MKRANYKETACIELNIAQAFQIQFNLKKIENGKKERKKPQNFVLISGS